MVNKNRTLTWVLRIGVAGEFFGHGVFALQGKESWLEWIQELLGASNATAQTLLTIVGVSDIVVALVVLLAPIPAILLWAAIWGFWTALIRPLVGEPIWDFVERWANWAAPLALLLMVQPKNIRDWFTPQR